MGHPGLVLVSKKTTTAGSCGMTNKRTSNGKDEMRGYRLVVGLPGGNFVGGNESSLICVRLSLAVRLLLSPTRDEVYADDDTVERRVGKVSGPGE